jgi:hypothetical protein
MAVFQKLPFKEKGRNVQDAVICLAAIDDLASSGEKVGALVSGDEIFSQEVLDGFCKKLNVSLVLSASCTDDKSRLSSQALKCGVFDARKIRGFGAIRDC